MWIWSRNCSRLTPSGSLTDELDWSVLGLFCPPLLVSFIVNGLLWFLVPPPLLWVSDWPSCGNMDTTSALTASIGSWLGGGVFERELSIGKTELMSWSSHMFPSLPSLAGFVWFGVLELVWGLELEPGLSGLPLSLNK